MPWTPEPGAGFTTGTPWLRFGPDVETRNVAAQGADPDSVLAAYRRILAVRRTLPALQVGALRLARSEPDVLAYRRLAPGPDDAEVLVGIAFAAEGGVLSLPRLRGRQTWRPVAATTPDLPTVEPSGRAVPLGGYQGVILVAERA